MGRGYIFEVVSNDNISDIGSLSEDDLYESIDALSVDYVSNLDEDDTLCEKEYFAEMLKKCGAEIGSEIIDGKTYPTIKGLTPEVKEKYFEKKFEKMKSISEKMTLREFSTSKGCLDNVYELKMAIEDNYSDMVYENYTYSTRDSWIREADQAKTYYLGNVVFLH